MKILQMIATAAIFSQTTAVSLGNTRGPSARTLREYGRLYEAISAKITPEDIKGRTKKYEWVEEF